VLILAPALIPGVKVTCACEVKVHASTAINKSLFFHV